MTTARPYQASALEQTFEHWRTVRAVCNVAPTGAGKTVIGELIARRILEQGGRVAFFAHRRELIRNTASRFERAFPGQVAAVMSDEPLEPGKPIQVASIQTCLKRDYWPEATHLILDECHHYASEEWSYVDDHYADSKVVGLTATPARQDGRALDMFQALVVVANYSELLRDGHLAQCKAYQPPNILKSALATDPLKAWQRYAQGNTTFAFGRSVAFCARQVEKFRGANISCAQISYKTPNRERDYILGQVDAGKILVVWSDTALTEGVDIPRAKCALLARAFGHATPYLQAAGRVLRPWQDKTAVVIDLCGSTLVHGLPTEDRTYSLDGKGIQRTSVAPLKNCPRCGATILSAYQECPDCGYKFTAKEQKQPKIWDLELREVYAGDATPPERRHAEWLRLLKLTGERGWSISYALIEYQKLFADMPDMSIIAWERRLEEYHSLIAYGKQRGFKPGYAPTRYKQMFGAYPPKQWANLPPQKKVEVA